MLETTSWRGHRQVDSRIKFHNIRREAAKYLDVRRLEGDLLVDVEVRKDGLQMSRRLTSEESAAMIKKGRQVV